MVSRSTDSPSRARALSNVQETLAEGEVNLDCEAFKIKLGTGVPGAQVPGRSGVGPTAENGGAELPGGAEGKPGG